MPCPDVVVIEDDADIREVVREVLLSEGYVVHAFENGRAALDGMKTCPKPCIILLDLMMPVMNGYEFLAARRIAGDQLMAIPVVIVSAFADGVKKEEGVVGYVKKPMDVELLLRLISSYCKKGHQENAA
jgi:CheY-like chemotaxis protein